MLNRTLVIATLVTSLSASAFAEDLKTDTGEAEKVIDEIVADAKMDEDGIMQPSTGAAKPTENWFGCKPI